MYPIDLIFIVTQLKALKGTEELLLQRKTRAFSLRTTIYNTRPLPPKKEEEEEKVATENAQIVYRKSKSSLTAITRQS